MNEETAPIEAVRALRARGVDTAEDLLADATPDEILAACRRWDSRKGVGPGLLVRWIRKGEFDEPATALPRTKGAPLRARFDEYAERFPVGSVAEPHARLQARRWPNDEPCAGDMIVIETTWPLLAMECDECGIAYALGVRHLHVLTGPKEPF